MNSTIEIHHTLYNNLLKSIIDPFFVISEDGTYLEVFGGKEATLYDDGQHLKGRNIYDFMPTEFAHFFMNHINTSLTLSSLVTFEYQLDTTLISGVSPIGPGGVQWFEARLYPLKELYNGKRAVTALILNITSKKELQQRLQELSYQDTLTKVGNRRYFFEKIREQLQQYALDKIPLSILLLDVDHYKEINDTYGHLAGDFVLQHLVVEIEKVVKVGSLIARFGGDEFIISIEGVGADKVVRNAEKLRKNIEEKTFTFESRVFSITVSIGVTF